MPFCNFSLVQLFTQGFSPINTNCDWMRESRVPFPFGFMLICKLICYAQHSQKIYTCLCTTLWPVVEIRLKKNWSAHFAVKLASFRLSGLHVGMCTKIWYQYGTGINILIPILPNQRRYWCFFSVQFIICHSQNIEPPLPSLLSRPSNIALKHSDTALKAREELWAITRLNIIKAKLWWWQVIVSPTLIPILMFKIFCLYSSIWSSK